MEESVDLHEEAGKENEQTLANLSLSEEATSKDEVEIEKFLQEQKSKNTQYKTKSDLNAWKKFLWVTSAQSEENQVSTSTTTQQNVFTVQQIHPQAIFAGAHIVKFEGCTFNINFFCGDQSKIARLNENSSLSNQGTNRHYLRCSCTFGHFS